MCRPTLIFLIIINSMVITNSFEWGDIFDTISFGSWSSVTSKFGFGKQFEDDYHDIFDEYDQDLISLLNPDQIESILELEQFDINFKTIDPEAFMTVDEIIRYHGYPVEDYEVETDDGYILTIQRIPFGKNDTYNHTQPRKPVLIQHGLICTSAIWVTNTADKNLPYILADAGYDVWLGNVRGTIFGNKNVHFTTDEREFWAYSFDEIAKYDIPKVIDKILEVTKYKQIYYVGHSMGTTVAFAMLSTQPKYNEIVKGFFALAPVTSVAHMRSVIRYLTIFNKQLGWLLDELGNGQFLASQKLIKYLSGTLCVSPLKVICENVIFILCGKDYAQFNATRLPVYLHHTPAATSVQNIVHYAQMHRAGKFQYQDFGKKKNMIKYGQPSPPVYNVSKITAPTALFWSDNDYLADPTDVSLLAQQLPSLVLKYRVPFDKFDHMDFAWAIDVKPLLYNKLVKVMHKMWP